MSRKSKGIGAERELIHLFHTIEGWSAVRVAGSGSNHYPSPDIVAGNALRHLAIECKAVRDDTRYVEKEALEQLRVFSRRFGAESWIAVRFMGCPWYFLPLEGLEETEKNVVIAKENVQKKGLLFEELVGFGDSVGRKI